MVPHLQRHSFVGSCIIGTSSCLLPPATTAAALVLAAATCLPACLLAAAAATAAAVGAGAPTVGWRVGGGSPIASRSAARESGIVPEPDRARPVGSWEEDDEAALVGPCPSDGQTAVVTRGCGRGGGRPGPPAGGDVCDDESSERGFGEGKGAFDDIESPNSESPPRELIKPSLSAFAPGGGDGSLSRSANRDLPGARTGGGGRPGRPESSAKKPSSSFVFSHKSPIISSAKLIVICSNSSPAPPGDASSWPARPAMADGGGGRPRPRSGASNVVAMLLVGGNVGTANGE